MTGPREFPKLPVLFLLGWTHVHNGSMNSGLKDHAVPAVKRVDEELAKLYPDARCELNFSSAFELLVATVLSAQTTDARVNSVTAELFKRWPSPEVMACAPEAEVEAVVRPLGMAGRRTAHVRELSARLAGDFGGEVPDDQKALESLAGVGRKTAHVVRGTWFGHSLLTVDTHVGRLARRLGWSESSAPRTVEEDVVARAEADGCQDPVDLTMLSHRLIFHGRNLCTARKPACGECPLAALEVPCPSADQD